MNLEKGVLYVVTNVINPGHEFRMGDRFRALDDGSILGLDAGGWLTPDDSKKALENIEFVIDQKALIERRKQLQKEIDGINKALNE